MIPGDFQKVLFILLLFSAICAVSHGQSITEGEWRGKIHYSQQTIPFTFEVSDSGNEQIITLINADERISIDQLEFRKDSILIPMHVFDAFIIAKVKKKRMTGYWIKSDSIPFTAKLNSSRFKTGNTSETPDLSEKLNMTFTPPGGIEYPGIGIFDKEGNIVTGTVLTEVGDYRFFEGTIDGNELQISSFDGVHAFMIKGEFEEGIWSGEYHFDDQYVETWKGYADSEAKLKDPFEKIDVNHEERRIYFDILAPASGRNVIDMSKYKDKVVIIQLFGTWCPNSYDQNNFLIPWYKENHKRGVEIIGVSYEVKYSKEYGLKRIENYKEDMGIPWNIYLGGRVNKEQAAMAFPFMTRLQAFPTLVILDTRGYPRYIHHYFLGPATGKYFIQFQERFNNIVEELLSETDQ